MKLNEHTALLTPKILLTPYHPHHVPTYHTWMQDPTLQSATASEPLTLAEEHAMQRSWRTDADKLTFIACTAPPLVRESDVVHVTAGEEDAPRSMIGDVNLFLSADDDEEEEEGREKGLQGLVGEVEIMIAVRGFQGRGLGREILLTFLWYIMRSYTTIMDEYFSSNGNGKMSGHMKYLRGKISKDNLRSIKLFESVGFKKVSFQPNYFGELELRWDISANCTQQVEAKMEAIPQSVAYRS